VCEHQFETINLWPYFSSSCFSGFGDDRKGFYRVYSRIFDKIDQEEKVQCCCCDAAYLCSEQLAAPSPVVGSSARLGSCATTAATMRYSSSSWWGRYETLSFY